MVREAERRWLGEVRYDKMRAQTWMGREGSVVVVDWDDGEDTVVGGVDERVGAGVRVWR